MKTFHIVTYGCRMNIIDSECLISIMNHDGYLLVEHLENADVIILNSCSVREDGHNAIYKQLEHIVTLSHIPIVVLSGCLAVITNRDIFKKYPQLNIVVTTHHYKKLPLLINRIQQGENHIMAQGGAEYDMLDNIIPSRVLEDNNRAAINIVKGCNQTCSYCIEPITRGTQHCRSLDSILTEVNQIQRIGYKELTLVGHLIDCYNWMDSNGKVYHFADVLQAVAEKCPNVTIRFLSSHPTYFSEDTLQVIHQYTNIAHLVHLPIQSASNRVLMRMHRNYTQEQFIEKYMHIKRIIPDMKIVTDIMVGFCGETEKDFEETIAFLNRFPFDDINIFNYSMREGTYAHRYYQDDVSEIEKQRRYQCIIPYKKNLV